MTEQAEESKPKGTLREKLAEVQTSWSQRAIRMPDEMWDRLEQMALVQGREQLRPKSVNSVILGILLGAIEQVDGAAQ